MLHMAVWRSPLAHATVGRVSVQQALALPGVVDAFDLTAFGDSPLSFPVLLTHESLKSCPQYPLARDRVRYVGEGVAGLVGEERAIAEDPPGVIDVSLEALAPRASTAAALRTASP